MSEQIKYTNGSEKEIRKYPDNHTLFLVSFFITNPTALEALAKQWAMRDESHQKFLGRSAKQTEFLPMSSFGGSVAIFDPNNLESGLVAEIEIEIATALLYLYKMQSLLVGSGSKILEISGGQVKNQIKNPLFNDIHGISATKD